MSNEEIGRYLEMLDKESDQIQENIIQLSWWMRGGVNISQAWMLTEKQRRMINQLIKDNLESSKKIGHPII